MLALHGFEQTAATWFDEAWEHSCRRLTRAERLEADHLLENGTTVRRLMPLLLELVATELHHDVHSLRPAIHIIITEQGLVRAPQGVIPMDQRECIVTCCVDTLVDILLRVRTLAIESGQWSDKPCVTPMCG
ncbi:MAG: hypothetical protein RLN76_07820 [Phycisphaeraceae bacterium]